MNDRSAEQLSTVERAFELARSGSCGTVDDIRRALTVDRYPSVQAHLAGPSIRRALLALCKAANAANDPDTF
ncbi:hypothetical protein [Sphingomonas pruni]|uniref:hypothetical protein n=1 Tax=Sphingomonas pruni TaxID=40683 RepID=UPI0008376B4B|nr:hypothetical protein [Sphingomonas pruni]